MGDFWFGIANTCACESDESDESEWVRQRVGVCGGERGREREKERVGMRVICESDESDESDENDESESESESESEG